MAEFREITLSQRGPAAWITLARPQSLNALTPDMVSEIDRALDRTETNDSTACVVFTGMERAFCAGADLKEASSAPGDGVGRFVGSVSDLFARIEHLPMPTIGAVNGVAVAGGFELLLACDILIAAEGAKLGDAHANYGMIPGGGGSVRLPRRVGASRAKYLMFTGEMVDAGELVACGLVARVVDPPELESVVQETAESISRKSPLGLRLMKRLVDGGLEQSVASALRNELLASDRYRLSADYQEGLAAFEEKRQPQFVGE